MKLLRKLITCINLILLLLPSLLFAKDTVIHNILISNSYTHLHIQLQLANCFNKKMEEATKTGIPITFKYYINLYQHRSLWNDKLLTATTLSKTIKYDNLKKEYTVTTKNSKKNSASSSVLPTLYEAKKIMINVKILSFYPMCKLERNRTYYFKIKAESKGVEPPRYIHYLLFFFKWMNFETDWFVEKFKY
ncbi:MAG: DUF4390 domain-containing protein [Deltaproteobacteria bacterium]|nr:DUF4390 domain-containing protein [Deltaproteobacteria bacterium]